jgi:geranylgeranyl diphosphate synthase type 3
MLFQKIIQPVKYIMQLPGKKMMAELAHSFNYWLKVPEDKLSLVKSISRDFYHFAIL